ncbi:hypothetical protein [Chthonobacter albigriseus]|uniref:hypothetical protein n=1 Tax=Chthonobacter albigriseus TaxID=1683161 RepID=UPI0015EE8CA6|nr:hypothetical protein [Chthonobacter albigriseus]
MGRKHQQEDPWAGFVDVLSNIVMVVTFLVIILGIAIFALSQQITTKAVEKALKEERERIEEEVKAEMKAEAAKQPQGVPTAELEAIEAAKETAEKAAKAAAAEVEQLKQQLAAVQAPEGKEAPVAGARPELQTPDGAKTGGEYRPAIATRLTQTDESQGESNLTVRSRNDLPTQEIAVASEAVAVEQEAVAVKRSEAFVTLKFEKASFKIDPVASGSLRDYLSSNTSVAQNHIEIRAFARSVTGSVSEARRIAYYRAMQVRNELVRNGFKAADIKVFVRESSSQEEADVVRIFAVPK